MYDNPSIDVTVGTKLNPTTSEPPRGTMETKNIKDNIVAEQHRIVTHRNVKSKVFNEDYQDNLMDEIFIV